MSFFSLSVLALLATLTAAQFSCIPNPGREGLYNVSCDSLTHVLNVPSGCGNGGCGLIFDIHGGTMSASSQNSHTQFRAVGADTARNGGVTFIVVNPQKPSRSWSPLSDHSRIEAFMRQTAAAYNVDLNRVHVTGFSMGGTASWSLLGRASDLICSAAPIASSGRDPFGTGASSTNPFRTGGPGPEIPRSIMYIAGITDTLASFRNYRPQVDSVMANYNMRNATREILSESSQHTWTKYISDTFDGVVLETLSHRYSANFALGGHCFPRVSRSSQYAGSGSYTCSTSVRNTGTMVVDFFLQNPCSSGPTQPPTPAPPTPAPPPTPDLMPCSQCSANGLGPDGCGCGHCGSFGGCTFSCNPSSSYYSGTPCARTCCSQCEAETGAPDGCGCGHCGSFGGCSFSCNGNSSYYTGTPCDTSC